MRFVIYVFTGVPDNQLNGNYYARDLAQTGVAALA